MTQSPYAKLLARFCVHLAATSSAMGNDRTSGQSTIGVQHGVTEPKQSSTPQLEFQL